MAGANLPLCCDAQLPDEPHLLQQEQEPQSPLRRLLALAPGWADVASWTLTITRLGGAWSNYVYCVQTETASAPSLLLRVYGGLDNPLISRAAELTVAKHLDHLDLGPRLWAVCSNARVEEYWPLKPLTWRQMRVAHVSVARSLAAFHEATLGLAGGCSLWPRARAWLALAQAAAMPSGPPWLLPTLAAVPGRLTELEEFMADWVASGRPGSSVVWAHNDVQHNNLLGAPDEGASADLQQLPRLIDYEYSCSAPAAYDIGNHFCEQAADYSDEPGVEMLDYARRYPDAGERIAFCAAYLGERGREAADAEACAHGLDASDSSLTLLQALAHAAHSYALLSHVIWGLWGVIQSSRSRLEWDFLGYALKRFQAAEAWPLDARAFPPEC